MRLMLNMFKFVTIEDFSLTASSKTFAAKWTPISLIGSVNFMIILVTLMTVMILVTLVTLVILVTLMMTMIWKA